MDCVGLGSQAAGSGLETAALQDVRTEPWWTWWTFTHFAVALGMLGALRGSAELFLFMDQYF
eukprot:GDKH01001456.1.p3 GENE.GDKH01001456.1~~GDKH01001456.1.p3  ORF type:complete len:62 (+),score=14.74 GDKH01001456.1:83-268(+)